MARPHSIISSAVICAAGLLLSAAAIAYWSPETELTGTGQTAKEPWKALPPGQAGSSEASSGSGIESTIESLELPRGQSLFRFTRDTILPALKRQIERPIPLPASVSSDLFSRLTPDAVRNLLLALPPGMKPQPQEAPDLSMFDGGTLLLNRPQALLTTTSGREIVMDASNQFVRRLTQHVLFSIGKGAFVGDMNHPPALYFVPFNDHDVREYTLRAGGSFEDKSYVQHCAALQQIRGQKFVEKYVQVVLEGFTHSLAGLTPGELDLLYDSAGIYMAENYKMIVFGIDTYREISGAELLRVIFLSPYLNQERMIADPVSGTVVRRNCSYFAAHHRERRGERVVEERIVSEYLRRNHAQLWDRFRKSCKGSGENIFEDLALYAENAQGPQDQMLAAVHDAVSVFANEGGGIELFGKQLIESRGTGEAASRILKLPPPPPMQPYY